MSNSTLTTLITIGYFLGSAMTYSMLWKSAIASENFPQKADGKSDPEFLSEVSAWFMSAHIMALIWPVSLALGLVAMILSILKAIISPK